MNDLINKQKKWITGIKKLYSQSFLLTHFIGTELNSFLDNCGQIIYHSSLNRIIGLTKNRFE